MADEGEAREVPLEAIEAAHEANKQFDAFKRAEARAASLMPPSDDVRDTSGNPDEIRANASGFPDHAAIIRRVEALRSTESAQAEMSTSLLRPGDVVGMQCGPDDDIKAFMYAVESFEWAHLGIGNSSAAPIVIGRLDGEVLPSDVRNKDARLVGMGLGGNTAELNILSTGRFPYFIILEEPSYQYPGPLITNFEIFRPDNESGYVSLEPQQLEAQIPRENNPHQARLEQIRQLLTTFDIDTSVLDAFVTDRKARNGGRLSKEDEQELDSMASFNNDQLAIKFHPSGTRSEPGVSNLMIYDKKNKKIINCISNSQTDVLKIGMVDLHEGDLQRLRKAIAWHPQLDIDTANFESNAFYNALLEITTYTTSGRYGLQCVNYHPSLQDAQEHVGIPVPQDAYFQHSLELQLWPDGVVRLDPTDNNLDTDEDREPGLKERILSRVSVVDSQRLNLNGKEIILPDPEDVLNSVMQLAA